MKWPKISSCHHSSTTFHLDNHKEKQNFSCKDTKSKGKHEKKKQRSWISKDGSVICDGKSFFFFFFNLQIIFDKLKVSDEMESPFATWATLLSAAQCISILYHLMEEYPSIVAEGIMKISAWCLWRCLKAKPSGGEKGSTLYWKCDNKTRGF